MKREVWKIKNKDLIFPNEYKTSVYLKNIIKAKNIIVGSYSYYDSANSNHLDFEKNNVLFTYESAFNDDDTIDNAVKITIDITPEMDAKKILSDIKNLVSIYGYLSSSHINILDSTVNKGNALEFLKQNNYIDDNIIVIGDDINDYEMLKKYNGVVMKKHDSTLNNLHKEEIESVHQYINKIR